MDEYFLQFLWKFQKFKTGELLLTSGEPLTVFHPGVQNEHAGPDFSEARIKIGSLVWSGSVELHYKASDWHRHSHHRDPAYGNVILHVVWIADREVTGTHGRPLPTLALAGYVAERLENEYRKYINQPGVILCAPHLPAIPGIQVKSMLDRAFAARLQEKGTRVLETLKACKNDWEETAYRVLGSNFGFKTNSESFERLCASLPYKVIKKHLDHPHQVGALVYGMAGFLEAPVDDYARELKEEFDFLRKKYQLRPSLSRHLWKFARMRPANFPTVRLAQFIALLSSARQLFDGLMRITTKKQAEAFIRQPVPGYWQQHYDFGKTSKRQVALGSSSVDIIIINSMVPLLAAYSKYTDDLSLLEKAEQILLDIKPEVNHIIKSWAEVGIQASTAADSQALIYQYRYLCKRKKCLQCNLGISILNK